jgi:hypothetical protein
VSGAAPRGVIEAWIAWDALQVDRLGDDERFNEAIALAAARSSKRPVLA